MAGMLKLGRTFALVALVGATIGCDRMTKRLATETLADSSEQSFLGDTLRLEYMENSGGFLSLGAGWPRWVRTACFTVGNSVMMLAVVIAAMTRRWSGPELVGLSLLVAGGLSNLADRVLRGTVVDFLNLGVGSVRTGVFNVADVAIMGGLALLALRAVRAAAAKPDAGQA